MKVKIPFKNGYLHIGREFHILPSNVRGWFTDLYWKQNQKAILEKVKENLELNMYLEIEEILEKQGIKINVKLKKEK